MTRMNTALSTLTSHQQRVTLAALAQEHARRHHVVVSLSGAHAYGFPSPDSDVDVKAVHLADTRSLLGLVPRLDGSERLEVIEGVEFDYSSNELGGVLAGLVKGNGNYFERFLSRFAISTGPVFETLRPLVARSLSRQVSRHYRGFASTQRAAWEAGGRRSAKKLLYVLRTLLTGTHALRTAEVETDLSVLAPRYGLDEVVALIEQKRLGEHRELPEALSTAWAARLEALFVQLDAAEQGSVLPPECPTVDALNDALVAIRLNAGSAAARA